MSRDGARLCCLRCFLQACPSNNTKSEGEHRHLTIHGFDFQCCFFEVGNPGEQPPTKLSCAVGRPGLRACAP